jgi:outer membrane protein
MLQKLITIITLLTLGYAGNAQVVFRSLEDAWAYADAHNITIRTARNQVTAGGYAAKQSYSGVLPQASASGSFTDNISRQTTLIPGDIFGGPAGTFRTLQFGQQYVYAGGVSAQMNLLNLQSWQNVRIARESEKLGRDSLANTRKTVYQQIATQYYSYLLMKEASRIAAQSVSIADSVFQSSGNKFKEGTIHAGNLDIAQLNLQRARQTLITAGYQVQTARNNLKSLLDLSVKDSVAFSGTLQESRDADAAGDFQEDPAVRLALHRTSVSLSQLRSANSAYVPTIGVLYNYTTQRYDNTFEPFKGATGVAGWFPAQYWSLQASIPIFSGGNRYYQVRRNKVAYRESMEQYESTLKQSAINDENIRLNYQKAEALLANANEVMRLSLDNYTHISNRYQVGISSLDDRLNAFRDYLDYQNQYLNSLSDLLVQLYQVKIRRQSF